MREVPDVIYHEFVCLDCGGFEQGDEASSMINRCKSCLNKRDNNASISSQTNAAGK